MGYISNLRLNFQSKNLISKMKYMTSNLEKDLDSNQRIKYINKPGIILSFDDSFRVGHWFNYGYSVFKEYGVKATFNVNAFHLYEEGRKLSQTEIDMLINLQSSGHEIAHHGYQHKNSVKYSNEFGIEKWVKDDILPLFRWLKDQTHSVTGEKFKMPVTFAYPGSNYNYETNIALERYFKLFRGHINGHNLIPMSHAGFAPSICIDKNHFPNIKTLKPAMELAKSTGRNLILMGHSILPDDVDWESFGWGKEASDAGSYRISPKTLKWLINEAQKMDLEFYTMAEAAGIATFFDPNLEKFIRKMLKKEKENWIMISDLIDVKKLDLTGERITNLGGLEYLLNLETLKLGNETMKNDEIVRSLNKLKNLHLIY